MAKAILEFDLNDPDDRTEHLRCTQSLDMACVLFDIQYNLKKACLYECEYLEEGSDPQDGVDMVFSKISELLSERGINIDDIVI